MTYYVVSLHLADLEREGEQLQNLPGVPSPAVHPIHRFLKSKVNLVIGADDPGIFDSPLEAEIDWVLEHTPLDANALVERLGDPRRFRLGQLRNR